MAKEMKLYIMPDHELVAKPELLQLFTICEELPSRFGNGLERHPGLYWSEYHFYTDGEKWWLSVQFYQETGMTQFPYRAEINPPPYMKMDYDKLTELITGEIPIIPNPNEKPNEKSNT